MHTGRIHFDGIIYSDFFETYKTISRVHLLFNPEKSTDYYYAFKDHGAIYLYAGSNYCIHLWSVFPSFNELEDIMNKFIRAYPGFGMYIGE